MLLNKKNSYTLSNKSIQQKCDILSLVNLYNKTMAWCNNRTPNLELKTISTMHIDVNSIRSHESFSLTGSNLKVFFIKHSLTLKYFPTLFL